MGQIKIHCDSCGGEWIVYRRSEWSEKRSRTCPVCGKSIDPETWDRQILKAVKEMDDANLELLKDHEKSHGALFTVSYIPDVLFQNRDNGEIAQLRDEVDALRGVLQKLVDGIFTE